MLVDENEQHVRDDMGNRRIVVMHNSHIVMTE